MSIGKYRDRVSIQNTAQTNESADAGGLTDTYTTAVTVWADVEHLSGERRYVDSTGRYVISYSVSMRYTDKVKLNSRLKWGSRYLYITDISDDKAKGEMKLMCREAATG